MEQRRHFSRVLFHARATLSSETESHPCELLDISFKGALVRVDFDEHWIPDRECVLDLELDSERRVVIRMDCKVAHHHDNVVGLHCIEIDLDSITHLRRLVELNVGDEAILQREVSALTTE